MDVPTKVKAWTGAIVGVAAVVGLILTVGQTTIAQEAQKHYDRMEAPTQQKLSTLERLGYEKRAHDQFIFCLEWEYEERTRKERMHLCSVEKDKRLAWSEWRMCADDIPDPEERVEVCRDEPVNLDANNN